MKHRYTMLANYLSFAQKQYNVQICIKDYCGFIPINKELDKVLQPFLAHTNAFCMYIKSDKEMYHQCLTMIRKMNHKCRHEGKTFFGMCHAGLFEYVTPIINNNDVIGTINVGFFSTNDKLSRRQIHQTCNSSQLLDEETALLHFEESISQPTLPPDNLLPMMELAAEYLSMTYDSIRNTHNAPTRKRQSSSSEDTILSHTAEYVRQNFTNPISAAELAQFCHCSESYLSHIFKRRLNVNISTYINKVRIEASKNFLVDSNLPISEIASSVGFNDPNYYSRVFNQLVSISPTEYKRRFGKKMRSLYNKASHPNNSASTINRIIS